MDASPETLRFNTLLTKRRRKLVVSLSSSESDDDNDSGPQHSSSNHAPIMAGTQAKQLNESIRTRKSRCLSQKTDDDEGSCITKMKGPDKDILLNPAKIYDLTFDNSDTDPFDANVVIIDADGDPKSMDSVGSARQSNIRLHIRSESNQMDEIFVTCLSDASMESVYETYALIKGLSSTAISIWHQNKLLRKDEKLNTVQLKSGDILDATLERDTDSQVHKKRTIQAWVSVNGDKEMSRQIVASSPLQELQDTICQEHDVTDQKLVTVSVDGMVLDVTETAKFYGLMDGDKIIIEIRKASDFSLLHIQLRFGHGKLTTIAIIVLWTVEYLIEMIGKKEEIDASKISLKIDGEIMNPKSTLDDYDIEGGELIEVCIR